MKNIHDFIREMEALGFDTDEPVNGVDAVDYIAEHWDTLKLIPGMLEDAYDEITNLLEDFSRATKENDISAQRTLRRLDDMLDGGPQ